MFTRDFGQRLNIRNIASTPGSSEELRKVAAQQVPQILDSIGVAVASTKYLLRTFYRLRLLGSGDIKKAIVFRAIWACNVRRLAMTDENMRYDCLDASPPPSCFLQPVSGLSIAEAMRMPYESVRRQIIKLRREGLCVAAPNSGLLIDLEALDRHPARDEIAQLSLSSMRQLIADLHLVGYDFSRLTRAHTDTPIAARAIMRIGAQLDMQLFDMLKVLDGGDLLDWFVNLAVWEANTSAYYAARLHDPDLAAAPNEARIPVTIHALSAILGMPLETTRRRINTLLSRGLLKRIGRHGVIVPKEAWADGLHRAADRRFCISITRAMSDLARQGAVL